MTPNHLINSCKYDTYHTPALSLHPSTVRVNGVGVPKQVLLTNTKQWTDKLVLDYINCWRACSLECKAHVYEASVVEMCTQGME